MDIWLMCFGIPRVGFYADNGKEFVNIKKEELIAKLGVIVWYGPEYSLWFNGINEGNYSSCDMTIRKLMA